MKASSRVQFTLGQILRQGLGAKRHDCIRTAGRRTPTKGTSGRSPAHTARQSPAKTAGSFHAKKRGNFPANERYGAHPGFELGDLQSCLSSGESAAVADRQSG